MKYGVADYGSTHKYVPIYPPPARLNSKQLQFQLNKYVILKADDSNLKKSTLGKKLHV
jgi:hypothetical protein